MKILKVVFSSSLFIVLFLLTLTSSSQAQIRNINASLVHPKDPNIVYLFSGSNYHRFDWKANYGSGARSTTPNWPGAPAVIDAALNHPTNNNLVYLFSGENYYRFNWSTNRVDVGPKRIASTWPGLPARVEAALNHPTSSNYVYFFSRGQYYRFNWSANKVDVGPKATDRSWPGAPAKIDGALQHPTNKNIVYLFSGSNYYRFNWSANKVDRGYPLSIASNWKAPSLAKATGTEIRNWFNSLPAKSKEEMRKAGITANNVITKVSSLSADVQRKLIDAGVPSDRQIEVFVSQVSKDFVNGVSQTGKDIEDFFVGLFGN